MNDEERLRALYQAALKRNTPRSDVGAVPLERLEALAKGQLGDEEALALIDRVMADPEQRREFELLRAIHASGDAQGSRTSSRWIALAAAAVLVVTLPLSWQAWRGSATPEAAAIVRGGSVGVVQLSPPDSAAVDAPVILVWRSVAEAVRYRVEVLSEGAVPVATFETRDSTAVIDAARLGEGSRFRWSVEAVTPSGRVRSGLASFDIRRP